MECIISQDHSPSTKHLSASWAELWKLTRRPRRWRAQRKDDLCKINYSLSRLITQEVVVANSPSLLSHWILAVSIGASLSSTLCLQAWILPLNTPDTISPPTPACSEMTAACALLVFHHIHRMKGRAEKQEDLKFWFARSRWRENKGDRWEAGGKPRGDSVYQVRAGIRARWCLQKLLPLMTMSIRWGGIRHAIFTLDRGSICQRSNW